ncbi:uncharacterized protein BCR38DRAFT_480404 [Pseudomassariella vexata]|uniref:FAD-binding PCMH-type domain-containing protein n=1 Tax=Pseudomassariella vexata TaxID=1141098 RepID=A0A1Y2EK67_9PEZI|nr:uncharacterized protein BCR38DRAFT_480404 [Pseudomassariella vexata]ORY71928.1 hypothetical protein BCR38DRAFT_480404 [Pseudomassariella vexata]
MVLSRSPAISKWNTLLLLICFSLLAGAADVSGVNADLRSFLTDPVRAWAANTTISFPSSTEFFDATERWTIFRSPTYRAAISPGTEEDVIKAVKLATSLKIPFLVTGHHHEYTTTLGNLRNGIAIDLSHFIFIELDVAAETVTIGPGVTAGDVFDPLYEAGFEIQTGSASCPALIGVTLGGGLGRFTGVHGLLLDALVSVRLITADGKLREVLKNKHPDLLWAIRGAGANFGVVTSATYKLSPLRNNGDILNADFIFPAEKSSGYFRALEALERFNRIYYAPGRNPNMIWNKGDNVTAQAASALGRELRDDLRFTSGYSEPSVFINYARGDETLERIYSRDNLPRLASLKKKWDPNHVFSFNNIFPTEYPAN